MRSGDRTRITVLLSATILVWLGVALSLGWYYTFTYYGRTGAPMPTIEPCAALVLYYFSVLNVRTEIQAVHWMIVFPISALLWAWALQITARYLKHDTPQFAVSVFALACAAIPLALPAPWMTWVAGYAEGAGFTIDRMLLVALRRDNQAPWAWLTPLYLGLGMLALALQLVVYKWIYKLPFNKGIKHYLLSAVVLSATAAILGATIAIPMRLLLE
ncbi:MAG TPA: hypothetical protein PK869_05110 [Candidatus Hydrogenedentes bacterium]|nr:hypothetical protein [Candidatus Hydrogenedentota bacterium]